MVFGGDFVFHAGQYTQFTFHRHIVLVSVFHDFFGQGNVVFVRMMGTIDHHGRETHVDARFAQFKGITVVEVKGDLRFFHTQFLGVFHSSLSHVAQQGLVGVLTGTAGYLQDDRRLGFDGSLNDGLHLFHVVEVEGRYGILSVNGLLKHLLGVDKA